MHCNETRKLSNSVKSMKHCGLPPHPPLQINRKIRKGSKQTKLKQNHTHDLIKASEKMKTPDENILEFRNAFITTSFLDLKTTKIVIKLNIVTIAPCFPRSRPYDSVTKHLHQQNFIFFIIIILFSWLLKMRDGELQTQKHKQKRENGSVSNY